MQNNCAGYLSTASHEFGHYLDLLHTHQGGDECVKRTNCEEAGDQLCDTPADPNLYEDGNSKVDKITCLYIGAEVDDCDNSPYVPDPQNFMSYSTKTCRTTFSPEQINRATVCLFIERTELWSGLWVDFATPSPLRFGTFLFPYKTLAGALEASSPGENIYFKAGTTSEALLVDKEVRLVPHRGDVLMGH